MTTFSFGVGVQPYAAFNFLSIQFSLKFKLWLKIGISMFTLLFFIVKIPLKILKTVVLTFCRPTVSYLSVLLGI